jgi:hypothetical protein
MLPSWIELHYRSFRTGWESGLAGGKQVAIDFRVLAPPNHVVHEIVVHVDEDIKQEQEKRPALQRLVVADNAIEESR